MSQTVYCPCDWENDYGGVAACDIQKPGVNRCAAILCLSDVEEIFQNDCDEANPDDSGVITDVAKLATAKAVRLFAIKETIDVNSSEPINDNGIIEVSETVVANGTVGSSQLCWVRKYKGKEVMFIFEDNDGELWALGHGGGFSLENHELGFGVTSSDLKAIVMNFANTTGAPILKISPDPAIYADNDAFMDALFV